MDHSKQFLKISVLEHTPPIYLAIKHILMYRQDDFNEKSTTITLVNTRIYTYPGSVQMFEQLLKHHFNS
jgi:hypothetical protein